MTAPWGRSAGRSPSPPAQPSQVHARPRLAWRIARARQQGALPVRGRSRYDPAGASCTPRALQCRSLMKGPSVRALRPSPDLVGHTLQQAQNQLLSCRRRECAGICRTRSGSSRSISAFSSAVSLGNTCLPGRGYYAHDPSRRRSCAFVPTRLWLRHFRPVALRGSSFGAAPPS